MLYCTIIGYDKSVIQKSINDFYTEFHALSYELRKVKLKHLQEYHETATYPLA